MSTRSQGTNERSYRPGQFLFHEGDQSASLFLIRKGTIAIRKMKGPAYVEIARIHTNEVIGELSFFDRLPRSASAVALTEVEALEISFTGLERIYDKTPTYLKTITAAMAERLRKANDQIKKLQKDVISAKEGAEGHSDLEPSAADALAAAFGNDDDNES